MGSGYRVLISLFLLCTSQAQNSDFQERDQSIWEPPKVFVEFPLSTKATAPKDMIKGLRVAEQPIVLEKTKLTTVQKTLRGVIGHRGDAGESLGWLCLHASDSHGRWVLWLLSGEIDDGSVGGFRWELIKQARPFDPRCSALSHPEPIVELPIRLHLGMTRDEVLNTLGKPTTETGETLVYLHEHELTLHNEPYTDMNTVNIVLRGKRVTAIQVWKSTTS
jgi:hypothetical protein